MFPAQEGEDLSITMSRWTSWPTAAWGCSYSHSDIVISCDVPMNDGAGTLFSGLEDVEDLCPGSGLGESTRCIGRQEIDQKPIHVIDPRHHRLSVPLCHALHLEAFDPRHHPSSVHRRPGRYVEENFSVRVDPVLPSRHEVCDQDPRQQTNLSLGV